VPAPARRSVGVAEQCFSGVRVIVPTLARALALALSMAMGA
jgi:hypothetical protein